MSVSNLTGIVVTDYHTYEELKGFCISLLDANIRIPFGLLIQVIEEKPMESIQAAELAALLVDVALWTGVSPFTDNVGYNVAINNGANWTLGLPVDLSQMTLAFFNSDTRILPGVLESCVELLWSDESYGAVGPRQVDDRGRITAGGIFGTLQRPQHRGWQDPHPGTKYTDVRTDSVTVAGSAYFIKAPVWQEMAACDLYRQVDPLSTGAFLTCHHYYGETWLSYHLQAHGYNVVYNGEVTMVHKWHKASAQGANSFGEKNLLVDREFFRRACDIHKNTKFPEGIPHD